MCWSSRSCKFLLLSPAESVLVSDSIRTRDLISLLSKTFTYLFVASAKLLFGRATTAVLGLRSRGPHDHSSFSHDSGSRAILLCLYSVNFSWISLSQSFLISGPVGNHYLIYVRSKSDYMFGNGASIRQEEWFVFLSRLHGRCTAVFHDFTRFVSKKMANHWSSEWG
jgi:hypothetical protein